MPFVKHALWAFLAIFLVSAMFVACGGDDEDEETGTDDDADDDDDAADCATMPDMVVDRFTFYDTSGFFGTDFSFTEIVICNVGGAAAPANSVFGFYLVANADFTGDYYIVAKSSPLVGFVPGDCLTFTLNATSSEVAEGYYYVYIVADSQDDISECNESNNWARSEEAIYAKPDETEPV
ncbi:MAG: CARDB domain-containing protein [Candidatus Lernaella stagnicola]|nr:CARDB domain-containing protein [Candidatus Lernaella stagnicola]